MTFALDLCSVTAVVGLLYPCLDSHLGEPHKFKREWASVMRCVAVFVGINHASVVSFHKSSVQVIPTTPCGTAGGQCAVSSVFTTFHALILSNKYLMAN